VRLADAGVHAPEPYVGPLAVAALVVGWLRRRRQPELASFAAYGPGLSLALLPSLLRSFGDDTPTRALVLLVVAVAVVVTGAHGRLRAPLVIGGLVVVADAVHLLAPYAAALPRWVLLAAAGVVLVLLGATYEQRLRDAARLREQYERCWV
jgi:MYXO-CTERM domain-containing protein